MERLYALFDVERMDASALARCLPLLPQERREKALRHRRIIDQCTSAAAYLLLLYALRETFGLVNPRLALSAQGKPYLPDHPQVHFNISHCPKGCVCAVADEPVGVDIQDIRPFSWRLAERCCAANELEALRGAQDPALAFTRMWAMKESFVKMTGEGLRYDVRRIDTTLLGARFTVFERNGCCIAAAGQSALK